jgi:saccharopine dehydrogenase-like NADP-dependent oxidoreductase
VRAIVLGGAGAVCKETTRDLARFSPFEDIVVADYDLDAAQALVDDIGDSRLSALKFDADDEDAMRRTFPEFDVVVNGLPFKYDLPVNKVCAELGVNGLDVSSEDPQFALHERALEKDMIFIPGVGATPGITNMMVARAAERLDVLHEVDIYFAAFRCLAPAPGLLATTLWEFVPEEEEREEAYFEDGSWHATPPMSGGIDVEFHELIGVQRVYYVPHDEAYTLPVSYPSLRRAAVRGCFPPHVMELMGALMRGGLLTSDEVMLGDDSFSSVEVVRELLWQSPSSRENPIWAYGLVVEVRGEADGRSVHCTYRSKHPPQERWGGPSAYFKNVGIPLAIGAELIASGQVQGRGVLPPERALPVTPFFEALAEREIWVDEQIVERGQLVA